MNRIRLLALGAVLAFAFPVIAQQAATTTAHHTPTVEQHLKALSEKLGLTANQQQKARPILKEMQRAMQDLMDDKRLTQEQLHDRMLQARTKADKKLREFLNDEQKKKLNELESQPHPELHGDH